MVGVRVGMGVDGGKTFNTSFPAVIAVQRG